MKKYLILFIAMLCLVCTSCSETKEYSVHEYRTTMQFRDNFRVMQLTDLHLGIQGDLQRNLNFVSSLISDGDPDLIVVTGDSFMYGTKGIVNELMEIILSFILFSPFFKKLSQNHFDKIPKSS